LRRRIYGTLNFTNASATGASVVDVGYLVDTDTRSFAEGSIQQVKGSTLLVYPFRRRPRRELLRPPVRLISVSSRAVAEPQLGPSARGVLVKLLPGTAATPVLHQMSRELVVIVENALMSVMM
jgi:hypothetical protein